MNTKDKDPPALGRDADYPECSGDPASCPENEGYGCCKPNPPPASVPDFYVCDAFISRLNEDGGCVDAILWKEPKANCIGVYVATPTTPEESP